MTETGAKPDPEIIKDKHKRLTTDKILYILTGVVIVAVILPPTVSTALRRWPELCCRYEDINIKTGQARSIRYLGFVKLSEEIRDTPISVVLEGKVIDVSDVEPWNRVYTLSPGLHSPHHAFHHALSQARELDTGMLFGLSELGRERKREIAENILKLWQTERHDSPVSKYLGTVSSEGVKEPEQSGSKGPENE